MPLERRHGYRATYPAKGNHLIGMRSGTATQSISSGVLTAVTLSNTPSHDGGGITHTSTVATLTADGLYVISAGGIFNAAASSTRRLLTVEVWSGSDPGVGLGFQLCRSEVPGASGVFAALSCATEWPLLAGWKLRLVAYHEHGSAVTLRNDHMLSYLNIRRV